MSVSIYSPVLCVLKYSDIHSHLCKDPHWCKWLECTEQQGGARKGTVKKALEDGELGAHIQPCPLELPADGGPDYTQAEPAASWTEPQAQSPESAANWEPIEASASKKRKWSEKDQTQEQTWDKGWSWQKQRAPDKAPEAFGSDLARLAPSRRGGPTYTSADLERRALREGFVSVLFAQGSPLDQVLLHAEAIRTLAFSTRLHCKRQRPFVVVADGVLPEVVSVALRADGISVVEISDALKGAYGAHGQDHDMQLNSWWLERGVVQT
eukprot:s2745_g1.t1